MSKATAFFVHGMGRHEPDEWLTPVWNKLVEVSKRYAFFQRTPLEDLVDPVAINYDDHMQAALQRWQDAGTEFKEFAKLQNIVDGDSLDWLDGIAEDDAGFALSHVADVVIYRFFGLERNQIQDSVKAQFAQRIHADLEADGARNFHVIAHSLGTAVAHDSLAEMGVPELNGQVNAFAPPNFRFKSIHTLANVSRVLQKDIKVYESILRPGSAGSATAYCSRLYDYRHHLDPFTLVKPYEPVGWSGFQHELVKHAHDWNLHGYEHFLDNPRVHIPILKSLRPRSVKTAERNEAVDQYPRYGGPLQNLNEVEDKLAELAALSQRIDPAQGLAENIGIVMEMWKIIGEIKGLLDGIDFDDDDPGTDDRDDNDERQPGGSR